MCLGDEIIFYDIITKLQKKENASSLSNLTSNTASDTNSDIRELNDDMKSSALLKQIGVGFNDPIRERYPISKNLYITSSNFINI